MKKRINIMGSKVFYYLFVIPLSRMPYFILYRVSDFFYFLMYYIIGYRKKVIVDNISKSFPAKSSEEITKIVKKFYSHFCDLIVESIKNFTVSEKQIKKRVKFNNIDVPDALFDKGKSIITIGGHFGNWEMYAIAAGNVMKHEQFGIYKPLSAKFFDKKIKSSRGAYGMNMIPMKEAKSYFEMEHKKPISIIFGSDQWPSKPERAYWTTFLGRETPFLYGAEKYAKDFDWAVVYCEILRIKRGHFQANYHLLTESPNDLKEGEIIDLFVRKLEKTILDNKPYWLWSHKRWKKTKEEVFKNEHE
tara:strand:+ start:531 stop:1439 length:909 start_codon:yes stop_codon:yes gene_type:complete